MALNAPAWLLANAFTKETADEFGAVKGAPCTVGSVTFDADGNTVVELVWTNSAGVSRTTEMKINAGVGIKEFTRETIDGKEHVVVILTDGTKKDAGELPLPDLSDYAKKTEIPTKVEDLDDAADYAKKTEIPEGSVVDEDLSETSKNPVQNKTVTAALKGKVDEVTGKGLSTNDYDADAKAKVDAIPADPKYTDTVYDDTDIKKDIAKKVDAETGKSLVSTTDIAQITANKTAIETLNGNSETAGSVDNKIATAIGATEHLKKEIIDHKPTVAEAKEDILYLVPSEKEGIYNQYTKVNGEIVDLDNTEVDLSGYLKTDAIVKELSETPSDEKVPSEKLFSDTITEKLSKKVDIQQDVADKGKALIVGDDGKLILGEVATSDIGSVEANILGWNVPSDMSLRNEVVGNKFIQKIARVDLGTLDWQYRSSDGLMLCQTPLESKAIAETDAPNIYCSSYKSVPRSGTESVANTDKSIALPNRYTIVHDSGYTDGTAYKTAIKGTYLYYELATPIEKVIEDNELLVRIYDDGFASAKAAFTTTDQFIDGNGSISDSDTYKLSDYIKTDNDSLYCCWSLLQIGEVDAYIRVAKYNSAKVFIERDVYLIDKTEKYKVIDTSNCEYIRVCYDSDDSLHFGKFNNFAVMDSMPNTTLTTEISRKEIELAELKMLGWNTPKEMPIHNKVNGNQFIQKVGRVDLGTLDWHYYEDTKRFLANHSNIKPTIDSSIVPNMVCAKYKTIALSGLNSSTKALAKENTNDGKFFIKDNEYTDADVFKTAIKGEYLYYELATPITKKIDGNEVIFKDWELMAETGASNSTEFSFNKLPKGMFFHCIVQNSSGTNGVDYAMFCKDSTNGIRVITPFKSTDRQIAYDSTTNNIKLTGTGYYVRFYVKAL